MVGQRQRIASIVVLVAALGMLTTGCKKDDETTNPPPAGITTFNFTTPNQSFPVTTAGGATKAKLTGGTLPYAITSAPSNTVATATLSNDTLTVTPVAAGSTSITIQDSHTLDNPPNVVTIIITVTGSGGGGTVGGSGSLSFTSTAGNMTASGTYNPNATSGSGVGVARYTEGTENVIAITGYTITSATSVTVAVLTFYSPTPITNGPYAFPASASMGFAVNYNPSDPNHVVYAMISGSATISGITATNVQGNFSGAGLGTPGNTSVTLSSGAFNVNSALMRGPLGGLPPAIEAVARKIVQQQLRQLSK